MTTSVYRRDMARINRFARRDRGRTSADPPSPGPEKPLFWRYIAAVDSPLFLAIETASSRGSVALARADTLLGHVVLPTPRTHTAELLPAIRDVLRANRLTPAEVGVLCLSQGPGSFTGVRVAATLARTWQAATGCRLVGVGTLEVIAQNAGGIAVLEGHARKDRAEVGPTETGSLAETDGGAWTEPERKRGAEPARQHGCVNRATDDAIPLVVLTDARQDRVYTAQFVLRAGVVEMIADAELHTLDALLPTLPAGAYVLGDACRRHGEALRTAGLRVLPEETWLPDARHVLTLGRRAADTERFLAPQEIVPRYLRPPECEEVYEQRRAAARARRGE